MLQFLSLRNFILVESLDLELEDGLTTLTGETGAGKSILLDAIGLLLGDRGDQKYIGSYADRCEIALGFDISKMPAIQDWLNQQDIPQDPENTLHIRRVIGSNARSRCYINNSLQSVSQLKIVGEQLIDIHGQNDHQSLVRSDTQRQLLDDTLPDSQLITDVHDAYDGYRLAAQRLENAQQNQVANAQRLEFLQFQLDELDQLALQADELAELDEEQRTLSHSEQLLSTANRTLNILREQDHAIESQLSHASQDCQALADVVNAMGETGELLDQALININEAADTLSHFVSNIDMDPQRLEWVEERLGEIYRLAKKHHIDPESLPAYHQELQAELDNLTIETSDPDALEQEAKAALEHYHEKARLLTKARTKAADKLSHDITQIMQTLSMEEGEFTIAFEPRDPNPHGAEQPRFLVRTNPGHKPGSLSHIASGGETSRISLAIQVASIGKERTPTLIFDEIDTGIGGKTAAVVGKKLRELAQGQQILSVTHLPQVAASGHQQLKVSKSSQKGLTSTQVMTLSKEERVDEIARMLGSEAITESSRANALELINHQSQINP